LKEGEIFAERDKSNKIQIFEKYREEKGQLIKTFWYESRYHAIHYGTNLLESILGEKIFDYPKSIHLIIDILKVVSKNDSIVLDYFAGSGTTGHAVLELNKEDNGKRKFILVTNNENNICSEVCYPRIEKAINGYKNLKKEKVEGLKGNLKYFKTDFVDAKPTDKNKKKLTEEATEMLCLREDTFNEVKTKNKSFKVFNNDKKYTGIIYDIMAIADFKDFAKKLDGKFSVYVFSLSDDTYDEEFEDMRNKVKLSPIPEAILRVYRRIFK
jgi:adenine-specific DNA-methyltransferase